MTRTRRISTRTVERCRGPAADLGLPVAQHTAVRGTRRRRYRPAATRTRQRRGLAAVERKELAVDPRRVGRQQVARQVGQLHRLACGARREREGQFGVCVWSYGERGWARCDTRGVHTPRAAAARRDPTHAPSRLAGRRSVSSFLKRPVGSSREKAPAVVARQACRTGRASGECCHAPRHPDPRCRPLQRPLPPRLEHTPFVSMGPGEMPTKRMPYLPHSDASDRVIAATPALAAADGTT